VRPEIDHNHEELGIIPQLLEEVTMKIVSFNSPLIHSKTGATLIELVVALLIIALVILGGGMFFFYGRVNIIREAHRRAALLIASQRVEALKAANWEDIALDPPSYDPYYLTNSSGWSINTSETKDTGVEVDDLSDGEMLTEAQWEDDDGTGDSYDYLKITVTVEWSDSTTNTVNLTTLIAPQ
jgi:type II secretory pathway pseudopilin PulG